MKNLRAALRTINDVEFKNILASLDNIRKNTYFVEVGAYDGISGDPIYHSAMKYQWNGLLVEPIKQFYDKLVNNYSNNPNVKFENSAVDFEEGQKDMFRDADKSTASLAINVNLKAEGIKKETVSCMLFDNILKKHAVNKIDLLHLDVEGKDSDIIMQFDFDKYSPGVINFEANVLTPPEKVDQVIEKLLDMKYTIYNYVWDQAKYDITAVKF